MTGEQAKALAGWLSPGSEMPEAKRQALVQAALQAVRERKAQMRADAPAPAADAPMPDHGQEAFESAWQMARMTIGHLLHEQEQALASERQYWNDCYAQELAEARDRQAALAEACQQAKDDQEALQERLAQEQAVLERMRLQQEADRKQAELELASLREQQAQALAASAQELQANRASLQSSLDEAIQERNELQEQWRAALQAHAQQQLLAKEAQNHAEALAKQASEARSFAESQAARLAQQEQEHAETARKLEQDCQARLEQQQQAYAESLRQLQESHAKQLAQERQAWEGHAQQLAQQLAQEQQAQQSHAQQLAQERQAWEGRIEELEEALRLLRKDAKDRKTANRDLDGELEALQAKLQAAQQENEGLRASMQALKAQREQALLQVQQGPQAQIAALRQSLEEAQEALAKQKAIHETDIHLPLRFTQDLNAAYFQHESRLKELFPKALYCSRPNDRVNGHLLYVSEKFGMVYLVLLRAAFEGLQGQLFKMIANFALNNIVRVKKYINSSKLIEEFFYTMKPSMQLLDEHPVEIGVCLIDTANLEVEFSSTGFPLYCLRKGEALAIEGGQNDPEQAYNRRFGVSNMYQVKKAQLLPGQSILLTSLPLSTALAPKDPDEDLPPTLHDWFARQSPAGSDAAGLQSLLDRCEQAPGQSQAEILLAQIIF